MSVTGPTDDATLLPIWLCNECYGRYFIAGFKHGVTSETTVNATRDTTLTTTLGSTTVTLAKRGHTKKSHFKFEFFDPHGIAPNGPIDTQYVSYWGDIANSCWGERIPGNYNGSYDFNNSFENSMIYYADLRDDILVYYHEAGHSNGATTGTSAMGIGLAYASFDGSEMAGCKTVNTFDAIKMPITIKGSVNTKEIITLSNYMPYTNDKTVEFTLNVAASDRSGYSGGVAYDTYAWGSYARIDQTKKYDCKEGVYTEEVSPEALESYQNGWEDFGSQQSIDIYDLSIWNANFNLYGVDAIKNGTYDYPNFVNIDVIPRGSFVKDADGNHFVSMITLDNKKFNRMNGSEPQSSVSSDTLVYYPVGVL